MSKKETQKKRTVSSGEWKPAFLAHLRETANVRDSCQAAGVARGMVYARKHDDPEFAKQWAEALEDAIDVLEATARKRALGESDTLMIFLLKAHRPDKYRERQQLDHSGGMTQTVIYLPQKDETPADAS